MTKIIQINNIRKDIQEHVEAVIKGFDFESAFAFIEENQAVFDADPHVKKAQSGLSQAIVKSEGAKDEYLISTEYSTGEGKYGRVRIGIPINKYFAAKDKINYEEYRHTLRGLKSWKSKEPVEGYALGNKIFQLLHDIPKVIHFEHKDGSPGTYLNMPLFPMTLESWLQNNLAVTTTRKLLTICFNLVKELQKFHQTQFVIPAGEMFAKMQIQSAQDPAPEEGSVYRPVHCDFKLANIFYDDATNKIIFGDFDFAVLDNGQESATSGSAYHMPPDAEGIISQGVDIYAIAGCLGLILSDRSTMSHKEEADKGSHGARRSGMARYRPIFNAPYSFKLIELRRMMLQELGHDRNAVEFIKLQVKSLCTLLLNVGDQSLKQRAKNMDAAVETFKTVIDSYLMHQLNAGFRPSNAAYLFECMHSDNLIFFAN